MGHLAQCTLLSLPYRNAKTVERLPVGDVGTITFANTAGTCVLLCYSFAHTISLNTPGSSWNFAATLSINSY